jgi:hypothetical protein
MLKTSFPSLLYGGLIFYLWLLITALLSTNLSFVNSKQVCERVSGVFNGMSNTNPTKRVGLEQSGPHRHLIEK